ncbi:uncharacterized protein LOC734987 [Xenopus laevis]|uniref:RING-type E3 ubiquitin transferase n=1 Tax=Xenopus laevis TaxID=8355 RepID=Q2TAT6_XENLA|nr:uncharacterized protein LOC734987 [Xenopus laevis]AAI10734.1 MGC130885 protein [Xenopus laevis]
MASKAVDSERSCVLCCQYLDIYAVGKCDHPVCYRCSTKMRVLCEQKYCAVCREELDKVVFVNKPAPFTSLPLQQMQYEKKHDIYFEDGKLIAQFRKLLQHECTLCPSMRPFHAFAELEQHMRKHHELFCCKLCVRHLKNFTYERTWYARRDLARHRIRGDPEDTSHRGHPLCKFCDERYLDNDELLKHLRRDHYFCHFCDSEGAQEYYSEYSFLREHFRQSHFLCEEGQCNTEQFTHAFPSEIDYKAHKTACHSKNRAEARQNRQIDIQFSYAPRHNRRAEGTSAECIQDNPADDAAAPDQAATAAAPPPDQTAPPPDQALSDVGTQTANAFYDHTELLITLVHQVNAMRQELQEVRDLVHSLQRDSTPPRPL